jgi:hypothetical protein
MRNRYFSMAKDVKDVAKALKLTKIIVAGGRWAEWFHKL